MDERGLRELIEQVRQGRLTRRRFVQTMVGFGLTAPMAAQLLGGTAAAQPREAPAFTPTKRGGGGDLRILMWDAPTLVHPHFGRGLRDFSVSRIFYEPLAAPAPDGTFYPVLADDIPTVKNGGLAKDGQWAIWRLKRNVTWHDGTPFTADDVVFNWQFAVEPANATSSRASFEEVSRIEKLDPYAVKVVFKKPQPFWAVVLTTDGLLPRHIFEPIKGAGVREAVGMVKAVGTGPYKLAEFKPGDLIRAEINPNYHLPNRPFFDRIEIKCGGDSPSAARAVLQTGEYDFAYYVLVEEEVLRRIEQGGKGRVLAIPSSGVSFIQCNQSDPWGEVDGERSSPKSSHPFLSDQSVRAALSLLVDRVSIHEHLIGRAGQVTANFLNAPERFRSRNTSWEFNLDKANQILDQAGWARGADGIRAKDGKRLKMVFQAAANSTVQKIQAVVKQAAARAGIEIEVKAIPASVFFSADVSNLDTNIRFLADLQSYTTFTGLDPQFFMAQFLSWELPSRDNKWTGRNIARWRNAQFDQLWRKAEVEMDPVKRAALFIKMNDLVVQSGVVIPVTWRNVLHAAASYLGGIEPNGWDSIFGRIAYWYRQG
ncbi:MAG TPA: peptide ABC transporter substrate-binding protein [Methylomirabilota bacterium]|jgi:peptide/nickel transport system substrate-binding protein|nr:peptide ABC transporter substrate-binding protein [Methylomirabilota bacterium]